MPVAEQLALNGLVPSLAEVSQSVLARTIKQSLINNAAVALLLRYKAAVAPLLR